jgi:hypothetical protein
LFEERNKILFTGEINYMKLKWTLKPMDDISSDHDKENLVFLILILFTFAFLSIYFRSLFIGLNAVAIIIMSLGVQ